jgi:hypothetical protein
MQNLKPKLTEIFCWTMWTKICKTKIKFDLASIATTNFKLNLNAQKV